MSQIAASFLKNAHKICPDSNAWPALMAVELPA